MGIFVGFTIYTLIFVVSAIDFDPFSDVTGNKPSSVKYDIKNARRMFNQFVSEYNKEYDNEEYERRYSIFVTNLEKINERNRVSQSQIHGITKFVDLTEEEFVAQYTGFMYNGRRSNFEKESVSVDKLLTNATAPDQFDWRDNGVVTPIKDQGTCNSCWAFGAVAVTESQYAIKHSSLYALSEQQLLDCWSESGGCASGNVPHLGMNAAADMGGFMQSSDYPYQAQTGQCAFDKDKVAVKSKGGYTIDVSDEEQLKQLISEYGPVTIAIHSSSSFGTYKGNIFMPDENDCPEGARGNHAITVIGYGIENSMPYWIIKNSYGLNWGENGYMRLIRGKRVCSILEYVAAAKID